MRGVWSFRHIKKLVALTSYRLYSYTVYRTRVRSSLNLCETHVALAADTFYVQVCTSAADPDAKFPGCSPSESAASGHFRKRYDLGRISVFLSVPPLTASPLQTDFWDTVPLCLARRTNIIRSIRSFLHYLARER